MKSKIVIASSLLFSLVIGSGCRKWLDVNQNPNVTTNVPIEMLLPSAQIAIASAVGADLQVNGSLWAQQWTQAPSSSQYKIYEQYAPTANEYDREWSLLYSNALMDLEVMERKAREGNSLGNQAIAKLLKAYTFQVITDGWGDVPFSQALKGQNEDGGIISPVYDSQESIYNGIHSMIDSARLLIEAYNDAAVHPEILGDLIYAGDMEMWRKFANTLQLKAYL
ncbi:MAG: SusD/RagB family nutrient-binding outer membrane lipoprotein, partial [Sphingobacteriales bacterium]